MEGFLMKACSDTPDVMLGGSQMGHLAIVFLDCCTQVAMLQNFHPVLSLLLVLCLWVKAWL